MDVDFIWVSPADHLLQLVELAAPGFKVFRLQEDAFLFELAFISNSLVGLEVGHIHSGLHGCQRCSPSRHLHIKESTIF